MTNNEIPITIDHEKIAARLARPVDRTEIQAVLAKASAMKGLTGDECAVLSRISDPEDIAELFRVAQKVKDTIYGHRLVLFAPLYISNLCGNECSYCAFRAKNTAIHRRALTQDEIKRETKTLIDQGHKRLLLVAGESYPKDGFSYVLKSIESVYSVQSGAGEIRRVNVNVAPLTHEEFKQLHAMKIGTYQIFQETYHRPTYAQVHLGGRKADYDWRVSAPDRAMESGINDVGIGILFGLYDWRFELSALMEHVAHLEKKFGVGPHTISVPRLEPATGSEIASTPPYAVSDDDFKKIIAILRLAVPYTGIILSTRESAQTRRESLALGVSQISAGSRTNPGGYAESEDDPESGQFSLGDHRPLDEVIRDVASMGYVPSFCTGCYRMGRTGADFMDLARPGDIKMHCDPNGLSTFMEYLLDYATPSTKQVGLALVENVLNGMEPFAQKRARAMVEKVKSGERDVYC